MKYPQQQQSRFAAHMAAATTKIWTVSFSGAGMLLPYHLGVARVLRDAKLEARAVAGSSSGAIAATLYALMPHRLEQFCDQFLSPDGGKGLTLIHDMVSDALSSSEEESSKRTCEKLLICTTKSSDGSTVLFDFDMLKDVSSHANLLPAIRASCTIPRSFHPLDAFSRHSLSYPDGVEVDGELYCDGGISSPAPMISREDDEEVSEVSRYHHLVISPISGPSNENWSIRPEDTSWALPFTLTSRCNSFRVRPSLQNLQAAFVSLGATSPEALRGWYKRGEEDALEFMARNSIK